MREKQPLTDERNFKMEKQSIQKIQVTGQDIDEMSEFIFNHIDMNTPEVDESDITWEDNSFDYEYGSIRGTHDPGMSAIYEGPSVDFIFVLPGGLNSDDIEYITDKCLLDDISAPSFENVDLGLVIDTWKMVGNEFHITLGWEVVDMPFITVNSMRKRAQQARRLEAYLDSL
jgi:hypothetical protein